MKRIYTTLLTVTLAGLALNAQTFEVPTCADEDKYQIMSQAYWDTWNDAEQARMDKDIDTYRKADGTFKTGKVKKGTMVRIEQIKSEFVFGASSFNWNQLGTEEANARYRELFGTLFNRATIPFYWKDFERKPGNPRYSTGIIDTEEHWNKLNKPKLETNWRRPSTDQIVDWCEAHGCAVHGHPLVWGNRKWQYPEWMQYYGIPENEQRALDTLEVLSFNSNAKHAPSYKNMTPEKLAEMFPTYLKLQQERTLQRIPDIMEHYQGRISSYDVVNESAEDFGRGVQNPSLPMCKSCYGILFSDYTFKSFQQAVKANGGGALLNINDYVVDERFVNQVADLLKRGAKIDVIGSQMHLFDPQICVKIAEGAYSNPKKLIEPSTVRPYFEKLGQFGIPTCLSEITIASAGDGWKGEMIQAIITRNLYRLWFSLPSMMGITWWNIVDDCGAPGEPVVSGLFRRDMTPKIAYYTLENLINKEWRTTLEQKPDSKGNVNWRGFKGTYKITWTDAGGKERSEMYILK